MTAAAKGTISGKARMFVDDNGYADHKSAWLDEKGNIKTMKVPALIQSGSAGLASAGGERISVYTLKGQDYTCNSAVAEPMNIRNADYPKSAANRVLFTHALTKAGLLGTAIKAAVTLPFRDYYKPDGSLNDGFIEQTRQNFAAGGVAVVGCEAQPNIKEVQVKPEGMCAFYDWAMNDKGAMSESYDEMMEYLGSVLVVDIGGSTTDLVTVKSWEEGTDKKVGLDHSMSGTEKAGVMDAKVVLEDLMKKKIQADGVPGFTGHGAKIPANVIERALLKGEVSFAGKKWDFSQERALACRGVAERINNYIFSTVKMPQSYYAIVVVGGGAIVFKEHLQRLLPNAVFSDEFANARGLLKYLIAQG
jgi:plasmid segregation protein ParM|tara:strand:- start:84823 stop:85908 length:1086 start_codon:yes stop_codon:yes gene_type:complete